MNISSRLRNAVLASVMMIPFHISLSATPTFNVRDFGATGDGTTLDSPAINAAIDAAAEAGGGTVLLPAGRYFSGSIRMKSNINLHLAEGAVIVADRWNSKNFDPTEPFDPPAFQDGGHTYFENSLIWGRNLTNVSITGTGMIYGRGLTTWEGELNKKLGFGRGSEGWGAGEPVNPREPTWAANKAIAFVKSTGIEIRDITILRGGWIALIVTGCDDVVIEGVTIDTGRDGINIDASQNVVVRNTRVNAPRDDAICLKATHVHGYQRPTKNVLIENCYVSGFEVGTFVDGTRQPDSSDRRNARVKLGTESSGGFINIHVRNVIFEDSMGFTIQSVDGALTENIVAENLTMRNVRNYVLYIVTGERNRTPNLTTESTMRNVRISNVSAEGVDTMSGIQIFGMEHLPIENLLLENIRIVNKGGGTARHAANRPRDLGTDYPDPHGRMYMPAHGIFARHVRNLELRNVDMKLASPDARPVAEFEKIQGLRLDRVGGDVSPGVNPPVRIRGDVSEITVKNSPLFNGHF